MIDTEKYPKFPSRCLAESRVRPTVCLSGLAALCLGATFLHSQEEPEDVFELSPFVIDAKETEGYRATSTLAGTRIKTELKDLGSAISVVTAEFMEDTGATDIEGVMPYLTNTEIGGMQGNFSGTVTTDFVPDQDESRRNPQSTARIRGLFSPNYTRGYFSTDIPIDSYNTGSITINRGANSLLFGLGSASGVIEASISNATTSEDSYEVGLRTDKHGSTRVSMDVNKVVIDDRLAVRLAAVHDDTEYRQNPAFNRSNRLTASFAADLFKNENSSLLGRTKLRGNVEVGHLERTPPDSIAPLIAYESFFMPPPDYRPYTNQDYTIGLGYDNLAAGWTKWQTTDTRPIPVPDDYYAQDVFASQFDSSVPNEYTIRWNETVATTFNTAHWFNDVAIMSNGNEILDHTGTGALDGYHGRIPLPGGPWGTHLNTRMYVEGPQGVGFKGSSLQDRNVFDYKNQLITGDLQRIETDFDAETLSLEQSFFEGKAGIEATIDQQYYSQFAFQPFGGGGRNLPLYIDGVDYLPNGEANPNVGRAMLITRGYGDNERTIQRDNYRFTAFYDLDFADVNDKLGKWLGRHTFTGLFQEEDRSIQNVNNGYYWAGSDFVYNSALNGSSNDNLVNGAGVVVLGYLSDDNRGKEMEDIRLSAMPSGAMPMEGDSYRVFYFDRGDKANLKEGTVSAMRLRNGGGANRTVVASEALAWQSYLFNGNLVGLVGWRSDEISSYDRASGETIREPDNQWSLDNLLLSDTPSVSNGNTLTWSVVGHVPQKFFEKTGWLSGLSFHYGIGENFQAIQQRNNIWGEAVDNPNGETTEYGITVQLADRWWIKVNKYETSAALSSADNTGLESLGWITRFMNDWQAGINDPVTYPFDSEGIGPSSAREAGFTSYQQIIDAMLNSIPEPTRSMWNYQYDAEDEVWERTGVIENLSEFSDVVAEGLEFEVVGNPTEQWRVSFNLAQTETTNSNTAEAMFAFNQEMVANMEANGIYDPVLRQGVDSAVGWVERWTQDVVTRLSGSRAKDGTVSQEQREWRANLVSNYLFNEGRLKGFNVGGALRWQSKVATGYEVSFDEFGNQIPDVDSPFYGDDQFNGDLWFGYRRALGDKVDWKIQLNLRNIVGSQDDIVTITNPDGVAAQFRIAPERTWQLSNTFSF